MRLSSLISAVFLICGSGASAISADLPGRHLPPAPVLPVDSAHDWSGFYLGATAGAGWTHAQGDLDVSSSTLALFPPILPTINAAGTNRLNGFGGLAGVTAGFNLAFSSLFVAGLEGDFSASGMSGNLSRSGIIPVFNGPFNFQQSARTDWLATIRGRVGVTPFDSLMAYVTGGLAVAQMRYSSNFTDVFNEYEFFRLSSARTGWTVGGGLEYAVTPNWSLKVEYLHAGFSGMAGSGSSLLTDGTTALVAHNVRSASIDLVRAGVNYRFGGAPAIAPVVAKY